MATDGVKRNLVFVDEVQPIAGAALRDTEGGVLQPSGHLALNANGTDLWKAVIRATAGVDEAKAAIRYAADVETSTVVGYAVQGGTKGAAPVKTKSGAQTVTLHLFNVFKKNPALRPTGARTVKVWTEQDENGVLRLVIDLQTAEVKRTESTKSEAPAQG